MQGLSKLIFTKSKTYQAAQTQRPDPLVKKKSRFPQAKLLVLVLRRIVHSKIRFNFHLLKIKKTNKSKYHYLNVIDRVKQRMLNQCFQHLIQFVRRRKISELESRSKRINIHIFFIFMILKIYNKNVKVGFNQLKKWSIAHSLRLKKLELFFRNYWKCKVKDIYARVINKFKLISLRKKLNQINILRLNQSYKNIHRKNISNSMHTIFTTSQNLNYQQLFKISQIKRKSYYDLENNKREYIASSRQNILSLKQSIQSESYERSMKQGQMKRDKAIKINQLQQKINIMQNQYQNIQQQKNRLQRNLGKLKMICQKRIKLTKISSGATKKVHQLFNSLKYQSQDVSSSKSFSFPSEIVLKKEKFNQFIKQFDSLKQKIEDFQIYKNINYRNLIMVYQNIPLDIKLSREYELALQQNQSLKQSLNSLICYDLLKQRGRNQLKQNNAELEALFDNAILFMQQQESIDQNSDQITYIYSADELKRKNQHRTSILSLRSTK